MLLEDDCSISPFAVRTIHLSTPSFLGAVLSEGSTPLYTVTTEDNVTTLYRHQKKEAAATSSTPLTSFAAVHWSDFESPESSPTDSPTFASRWVRSWSSKEVPERAIMVDVDGKRIKSSELLKTATLGGSRKYYVDGKSFKWKHVNGLWQCFHSKDMIAVFEPSIVTAAARIRILPTELSITRRIFDMLVLTCLLVVTHPSEWHRDQRPSTARSPPVIHLQSVPSPRSARMERSPSPIRQRTQSQEERSAPSTPQRIFGQRPDYTLNPFHLPPASAHHVRASQSLSRLVIPIPNHRPHLASAERNLRRAQSLRDMPSGRTISSVPSTHPLLSSPQSFQSHRLSVMTVISRSPSVRHTNAFPRPYQSSDSPKRSVSMLTPSGTHDGTRHRHTLAPILSPVADERITIRCASDSELASSPADSFHSHQRIWERPDAYPIPYSALSPSSSAPDLYPPPYTRRDPLAPPPPFHAPTNGRRRPRRTQLVLVS
ncbi:hypothetical protein FRB99_008028 [Tulasnella sp. 403]|nr:hypothetical protein FRB99_008028 [Tulasnella sp. 403]